MRNVKMPRRFAAARATTFTIAPRASSVPVWVVSTASLSGAVLPGPSCFIAEES
jgi:hypothetical protein